jgi:hypothetical protein
MSGLNARARTAICFAESQLPREAESLEGRGPTGLYALYADPPRETEVFYASLLRETTCPP